MAIRKITSSIIIVFVILCSVKKSNAFELSEKFNADSFQKLNVEEKIAFVQEVLEEREAQLQNFEYDINMKTLNIKPNGEQTDIKTDESWTMKRKGEKLFLDTGRYNSKNNLMNYKANWDGSVGKTLWYDPDGSVTYDAVIKKTEDANFRDRAYNYILGFRMLEQEKLTLPEWFKDANEQGKFIDINITSENGRELIACDIIHGYKSYKWCLDVNRDFMPVRADILYKKDENYNSDYSVVSEAIEADGFWVPTKVIRTTGTSVAEEVTRHTYVVSRFTRNTVKDEDFIINYPVGTRVGDYVNNVLYKLLPDGEKEIIRFYDPNELVTSPEDLIKKLKALAEKQKELQPVLLNKPLPELKEFGNNLLPADANDKMILMCFFDLEQRPSRNCIQQLSKRAQELKSKDIEIITIHASKIEHAILDEWNKEYNISFPAGMIQKNEEQTRNNWGVKALPWLILTNKEHIVIAEGLSLDELDEKIGESIPITKDDIISKMRSYDETFMQASTIVIKTKGPVNSTMQAERGDKIEDITITLNKNIIAVERKISYTEMPVFQSASAMDYNPDGTLVVWRHTRERSLLEPDFQGHSSELKSIRISPDGQTTEFEVSNPSFDFYRPDDMQRYKWFWSPVLATGRGFSQYLDEVIEMQKSKDGLISFSTSGFSPFGIALTWQMVVDPNADYLVRSASYKLENGSFSLNTSGTKKFDGYILAQQANIGTQMEIEIQDYKPDVNVSLLETTRNILRGPLPKGARVYDWIINPGNVVAYIAGDESEEKAKHFYKNLKGKDLPDLKQFITDFDSELVNEKMILICFFDLEQRPSRNCVLELSKKAQELKAKDIEIILVHASKIEKENLDKWLREYSVDFPVGMIESDPSTSPGMGEEETRFNWGVRALPWLILTDKEHIVKAEGFNLDELDNKLKKN